MKYGRKCRLLCWLLLLPGMIFLLMLIDARLTHPYDDNGFGRYYGFFKAKFSSWDDGFVVIEGRSDPEWRWSPPSNYSYRETKFEWSRRGSKESGDLYLPTMTLVRDGVQTKLDSDWFQQFTKRDDFTEEVLKVLNEARDGRLLGPRHHPYSYGEGWDQRSLTHFSLGLRFPYSVLIGVVAWLTALLYFLTSRVRNARAEQAAS